MEFFRQFAARYLIGAAAPLSSRERWFSALAGFGGILLMQGVLAVLPVEPGVGVLLAPLGATTVILYALPHSPLAQPWSLLGGLLLSALVGHLAGVWIHPAWLAIGVALGVAIWLTALLRCIHPPGGAMAVVFALAAQQHGVTLLTAVLNVAAALIAALAVNNLLPGRRYPHCVPASQPLPPPRHSIQHDDLQAALEKLDTFVDISEDELIRIYDLSTAHAFRRHEQRSCGEIMSFPALSVEFGSGLDEAWQLMRQHRLDGVPVIDRSRRVIGVLTLDDFQRHVKAEGGELIGESIRRLLRPSPGAHSDKPEVVGQIMSLRFVSVRASAPLGEAASRFAAEDVPALIPVLDDEDRLAGVITQTDLLVAIYHRQAAQAARL